MCSFSTRGTLYVAMTAILSRPELKYLSAGRKGRLELRDVFLKLVESNWTPLPAIEIGMCKQCAMRNGKKHQGRCFYIDPRRNSDSPVIRGMHMPERWGFFKASTALSAPAAMLEMAVLLRGDEDLPASILGYLIPKRHTIYATNIRVGPRQR